MIKNVIFDIGMVLLAFDWDEYVHRLFNDEETEKAIYDCVMTNEQVMGVDLLHTRVFGNKIYVDVEIQVNGSYTLREAHEIAEVVHDNIERTFPKVKHIMVHVNPADTDENSEQNNSPQD